MNISVAVIVKRRTKQEHIDFAKEIGLRLNLSMNEIDMIQFIKNRLEQMGYKK